MRASFVGCSYKDVDFCLIRLGKSEKIYKPKGKAREGRMDNLETNTMILEQCRLDMDNLAVLGATGMNEAVVKAEKRARTCNQELRQASKAVELTAKQKKTVEDARTLDRVFFHRSSG